MNIHVVPRRLILPRNSSGVRGIIDVEAFAVLTRSWPVASQVMVRNSASSCSFPTTSVNGSAFSSFLCTVSSFFSM
eukprot:5499615-Heterocapsa_arctica.AAC.1